MKNQTKANLWAISVTFACAFILSLVATAQRFSAAWSWAQIFVNAFLVGIAMCWIGFSLYWFFEYDGVCDE